MGATEIHLLSAGSALPGPAVDNASLARRFGMDALWEQWVDTFVGTRSRHLAVDLETGEVGTSLADLGEAAARAALSRAGLQAGDVDVIVMATATPDSLMPATVNVIADRLGVDQVPSYQLQSGCSGAVQALDLASQILRSGRHRTALVLGGDVIARFYDLDVDLRSVHPAELVNFVLFGDGAGAAVLRTDPGPGSVAVRSVLTRLVGLGRAPGATLEWFGPANRGGPQERPAATEDYKAIEELVPVMSQEVLHELLDELEWKGDDVDYLLPPQLSGRMTALIGQRLGVGSSQVSCVHRTGNVGNAIVFFQLEQLLQEIGPGERAVVVSIESSKWIKSGLALEAT
ncbi:3-oxoacyl-ACP synthase III family protein [Frankia sp. AgPm24]|uniref:3-oxoacyl-ACP synthase III family protein n=1 Tax=Frankia umida TaxID=573489 RepID=A0ABT0K432_9ACTN|nr:MULTISPECIES: 3-oxoacyl-ACP synthase III family protein [Frankia]MCK9878540.1 3-oxoacyl-ACP synthase III family protein [Frankia umida]MCK9925385.1 3-oxoacyl-ACP synthase III family protein [Frankia sp. AgPm24]